MLGVIGRNGAGKSTLLRLVGGVGRPSEGRIETHGRIRALLDLGSTFQPDLSGRENTFLCGVVAGLTRAEVRQRFDSILMFAEVDSFVDNPVRTYSTGMKTRLAFSIAVHTDPEILLVDEVLAVGDLGFQNKCMERISRFKEEGCAILLVSHDTSVIQTVCDEALWLKGGRVAAYGEPNLVVDEYVGALMLETRQRTPQAHPAQQAASGLELSMNQTRFGSLELEILRVLLTDGRGSGVTDIDAGEPITVEIEYETRNVVTGPHFAVTILREDGLVCFDTTTELDGHVMPDVQGAGTIHLRIDRLDLAGGLYYVDVGAYEREWSYAYDLHHRVYPIRLRHRGSFKGVISTPHAWRLGEREKSGARLLEPKAP